MASVERLENAIEIGRIDTPPEIAHAEMQSVALRAGVNLDSALRRRV